MTSICFKNSLLLLCFVSLCSSSLVFSLDVDAEILIRVKNAMLDDPNGNLSDWVETTDQNPCKWTGITCDSQNNQSVVSIDLSGFGISGGFPTGFCRIWTLQNLSLADNFFNGTLTYRAVSPCSHLHALILAGNVFVGELPDFLQDFDNLLVLDLSRNNFTGDIPASYGRLQSLKVLCLAANLLSGSIPWFLTNLSELTRLELAYNPFKPSPLPKDIGNLSKLENLFLASTNLNGEIPDSIGKLWSLYNLDLSNNFITGKIPVSISQLKSIEQIELFNNQLYGELPESLSNLTSLLKFDASQNNLTGNLPEKIAAMQLQSLNLNDNHFTGEIPEVLALNPNLSELKIFNNSFTGKLPANLGRYSDLENFDVSTNNFSGELPQYLCHRNKLQTVITFRNRFSGSLPETLSECSSLNYVRIADNELSGPVPIKFWGLHTFLLELSNNKFEGPISPSISGARGLTRLLISGNNFSGKLPAEMCELHEVIEINLGRNQFEGELPSCITELKKLQKLDMQENMFSGEIPSSVGSLRDLTELNLSRNRLCGKIPPGLGNLPVLTCLDLSDNLLIGEIPMELTKLKLNEFNVSDNRLYGKVPSIFTNALYLPSLLGNPDLCSPDFKPLPPCSKPEPATLYTVAILAICVLIFVGSLIWFFKAKTLFVRKPKPPYKVTAFQRVGFTEEDIFPLLTKQNLIGSGGSGQVYKVTLKTGQIVAVKRLRGGTQKPETESAFRSEVETLGRVRHGNIVKLLMCCSGEEFRILAYEYMVNGSLGDVLHGEKGGGLLNWPRRFAVALGAAQGLAYLHHDCVPPIVHRDVKSNNILLDEQMRPKVADFGLAKTLQSEVGESDVAMSRIAGSYGYIAPEYAYTLKVTEKSDVYSFGVVLMELITGKRPIDSCFGENKDIVKWVTEATLSSLPEQASENDSGTCCTGDHLKEIIDPKMDQSTCNFEEIEKVLNVALLCTSAFPINRPSMRRVVELLKDQKFARPKYDAYENC
ncbi:hypothetical protein P3X46_012659 [Hevea brasiliensis]|uniref:Protein kinase domain-containing protein n=1 Tax=Hevea brasiliensis TaxID=3981 RepID=A0ABQ9MC14_HEVBR|nr:LRR receptor-like serine/threonine-protein kinase HSL2 [Hevea brasiliensis]KAJ9177438.1 hypothetical protein P3X46_012659 [Hevea brasiliensis]